MQATPGSQSPEYNINPQQARATLSNPGFVGIPFLQGISQQQQPAPQQQQQQQQKPQGVSAGLSPQEVARFRQAFAQLDGDKDGYVAGGDCFPVFMKSGLDKSVLRHVWDLVAGNEGRLDERQFLLSQYLIVVALKGEKLPAKLPPNFAVPGLQPSPGGATPPAPAPAPQQPPPPVQPQAPPQPQFQMPGALPAVTMVSPVSSEFQYNPSGVPQAPATYDGARQSEQLKMKEAQEKARKADEERQRAMHALMQSQRNKDLFRDAMQELVIFKSRADAELIQLSAQCRLEEQEAERLRTNYEALFAQYGEAQARYKESHDQLMAAGEERAKLQGEVDGMANRTFDENEFAAPLEQVRSEIAVLRDQLTRMRQEELQRAQREQSVVTEAEIERQNLRREIETYEVEVQAARAEADRKQAELAELRDRAQEVLTKAKVDKAALSSVLGNCGQIYLALSQAALSCGVEIPTLGQLKLEWSESLATNASAWEADDLNEGYTVVENLGELAIAAVSGGASFEPEIPVQLSLGDAPAVPAPALNGTKEGPQAPLPVPVPVPSDQAAVSESPGDATGRSLGSSSGGVSLASDFGAFDLAQSGNSTFRSEASQSEAKPEEAKPVEAKPAEAKPAEAKPEPVTAQGEAASAEWFSFDS